MRILKSVGLTVMLLLGSTGGVYAFDGTIQLDAIVAEQTQLREEIMSPTGRFSDMPSFKRDRVLEEQAQLLASLRGKTTVSDLSPDEHTRLANQLEFIETSLSNREDERIVCERVRRTGSKMVSKVCKSVAQIKAERDAAERQMQSSQGICNSPVCSENLSL